jgi:ribonuclease T1
MTRRGILRILLAIGLLVVAGCAAAPGGSAPTTATKPPATTATKPPATTPTTATTPTKPPATATPKPPATAAATSRPRPTATPGRTPTPAQTIPATDPTSGLATMTLSQLPPEAGPVIVAIRYGGPFAYRQDGVTFQNREKILPKQPNGYYREYTVPTPGSPDRGARRIVMGREGEMYYTDDHYASFRRVYS